MDVFIQGKGRVRLSQSDFKAQGGEGSVYVKGGTAFKLYADPAKMIPRGKVQELARLTQPGIVKPEDVLLDSKNAPIGYTMQAVVDTVPLCSLFPKAYRDRNGLTNDTVLHLVKVLQDGVRHCHDNKILIVDLNEMNFLVSKAHDKLYFIDVDSYQTPSFPATALMESVRDRQAQGFSEGTDWFAFGIVSFQMWVGLHPYKGKHAMLKTLDERMQQNASVLGKNVGIPASTLPLTNIPQAYRDWYEAVFERGQRLAPPDSLVPVVVVSTRMNPLVVSHQFTVDTVLVADGDIVAAQDNRIVSTRGVYVGGRKVWALTEPARVGVTPKMGRVLTARIEAGQLHLFDATLKAPLATTLAADDIMATDGRFHIKQGDGLFEVETIELPATTLASVKRVGNVVSQATQLWPGVALQNLLGAYYASLLPESGSCHQVRLPELDGSRIVDARFERGVLVAIAEKSGSYDRWRFRFDAGFTRHDADVRHDVGIGVGINFTVLDSGIVLLMNENDEIEVFSRAIDSGTKKILKDPAITSDCQFFRDGAQALFARGNTVYRFTMRSP